MGKVVTVIGARPQFIKAATVSRAFAQQGFREVLVHTGQHYDADMSDVFFHQMEISRPDYHLGVGGGLHGAMTGRQLEKIEEVLLAERPDCVLVYGDTNSTLAGALAAAKLNMPVAHVEAGLRSFNRRMPEEVNRILTDHVSTLLFAPTSIAVENLAKEGVRGNQVKLVGDVMYDAALFYKPRARKPEWFDALGVAVGEFELCTIHRAENTDDPVRLKEILQGLEMCGGHIVLPLHPRTRVAIERARITLPANVHSVPPVGYLEMTWLEMHCSIIATDSGGVQKEAYFHGKPCVTLREETEWVELVEAGVNRLVQPRAVDVRDAVMAALSEKTKFVTGLYGSGDAARLIVRSIVDYITAQKHIS